MSRKNKEISLQIDLETQEDWDETLSKGGLLIVDVYQEWAGPCKPMTVIFKKVKNEIGDDMLQFATAKCNSIESLHKFKGKCEPCFLFYAGGVLVNKIKGANSPLMNKTLLSELAQEHKVLKGDAERKELVDPSITPTDPKNKEGESNEDKEQDDADMHHGEENVMLDMPEVANSKDLPVAVAILKPDLIESDKTEEILEKIRSFDIEILEQMEVTLTEELVLQIYQSELNEETTNEIVQYMTRGPCVCLILSKGESDTIIEDWKQIMGPESLEEAKDQHPDCLRSIYATSNVVNSFHGSKSAEAAKHELELLFKDFILPKIVCNTQTEEVNSNEETNNSEVCDVPESEKSPDESTNIDSEKNEDKEADETFAEKESAISTEAEGVPASNEITSSNQEENADPTTTENDAESTGDNVNNESETNDNSNDAKDHATNEDISETTNQEGNTQDTGDGAPVETENETDKSES